MIPDRYYTRRPLTPRDYVPAIGVGLIAGALAFYVTCLFLQRTPLEADEPLKPRPGRRSSK